MQQSSTLDCGGDEGSVLGSIIKGGTGGIFEVVEAGIF
jgi:hypothetical protein